MGGLWQIIKRWWALMSCALFTALGTYVAYAEKDGAWAVKATFALAGVCFIVAILQEWMTEKGKRRQAEKALASVPLNLELAIEKVIRTRSGGTLGRFEHGDVFIQASAHLLAPDSATVEYVVDLVRNGFTTHSRLIDDVDSWGIMERKYLDLRVIPAGGLSRDVQPLPPSLSVMRKSDGWLHFQVDNLSDLEITESRLRLTAASLSGMTFVERDLRGSMFGPLMIKRKMRA